MLVEVTYTLFHTGNNFLLTDLEENNNNINSLFITVQNLKKVNLLYLQ